MLYTIPFRHTWFCCFCILSQTSHISSVAWQLNVITNHITSHISWMSSLTRVLTLLNCGSRLRSCETVPTVAAVHGFCRFHGVPKVQPAEDTQTMTHARSTISLVVRVISRSKNNFYDVIRLKLIESRYFPKETVKVGLEKIKQNGGQLKATTCRWISSAEISNLDVDRDFSR